MEGPPFLKLQTYTSHSIMDKEGHLASKPKRAQEASW